MKRLMISFLILLAAYQMQAQEYKVALNNSADSKVVISITGGDLTVKGYDGNEVKISTDDPEEYEKPERAKGLKSLYNGAEDNTGLGLSVVKDGNVVKIVNASRHDSDYQILVPKKVALTIEQVNWGGGDTEMSNLDGEIEIKSTNGDITLKNISGPLVASSTAGDLVAEFSALRQGKPTAISVVSGDLDITLPADSKANFKLQSISGEIYTDFDIAYKKDKQNDDLRHIGGGYTIDGSINGGGTEMSIKTISGDIFIRRKK